MSGFMRATRGKQFNESAQQLVTEAVNYYQSLRESLSKMTGHRGYSAYFESWTPALMEDGEEQETNLNELFVQETLDPRIESVMPILGKLQRKLGNIKQVDELAEWADNIIEDWKGELAGGTLGGVGGTLAGSELGALAGGPVGAAIGAVVGGAAGGTAGQMAGRKLTDKDQLNEFAPLLAAGARAIIPLLSRIGPTLGQMASSAGKAGAGVAGKTATGIGRGAVDVAKSAAQSVAQNAGKVGVGVGAYQAITDVANSVIGGVGEVYRDVGKATIAIAQAVGNAVDRNTITELANAAVKYSIPIGILLAVLYGGKKLIDQVLSEEIDDSVAGFAGKLVGDITPNPNDFVAGFKKTFEGANESVNESEDELARILQMVKHKR